MPPRSLRKAGRAKVSVRPRESEDPTLSAWLLDSRLRGMNGVSPPARGVDQTHDDPYRDDDHRSEQEITPHPTNRIEPHVPDRTDQPLDAVEDVEWIEANGRNDQPNKNHTQT